MNPTLKAILTNKETYFAIVFVINAIAAVFGYGQYMPSAGLLTLTAALVNLIPAAIAFYKHPVLVARRADAAAAKAEDAAAQDAEPK